MPTENSGITTRKPTARSRITNGRDWLPGIDQRSTIARRYRDLVAEVVTSDLGGIDRCSQAKLQLARRFAALAVQLEALEAKLADGAEINIQEYATLTSTLVRVISRLGIERVARDVITPPNVADYLKHKQQRAAS
jgi:hypothetical protein